MGRAQAGHARSANQRSDNPASGDATAAVARRLHGLVVHGGDRADIGARGRREHRRHPVPQQEGAELAGKLVAVRRGGPDRIGGTPRGLGPQEALDRIEASPGSSLIISDEALSSETGKGTEFVVIMSDEPQGGIKMRRRNPDTEFRYASPRNRLPYWSPFAGPYSRW